MDSNPWEDADSGFEALGYSASHLFAGLSASSTVCHIASFVGAHTIQLSCYGLSICGPSVRC